MRAFAGCLTHDRAPSLPGVHRTASRPSIVYRAPIVTSRYVLIRAASALVGVACAVSVLAGVLADGAMAASSGVGSSPPAVAAVERRLPRVLCVCVRRLWDFDYPHGMGDGRLGDRRAAVGRGSGAVGGAVERAGGARCSACAAPAA